MTQNNQNMKKGMFPYMLLLVIGLFLLFTYNSAGNKIQELTYNQFNKALVENNVKKVSITPSTNAYTYQIRGELKKSDKSK